MLSLRSKTQSKPLLGALYVKESKISPVAHLLISWPVSYALFKDTTKRERIILSVSGLSPDIDGFGLVVDFSTKILGVSTNYWSHFHHNLHSLPFGIFVAVISMFFAKGRRVLIGCGSLLLFHIHLLCDLVGSKGSNGYQWPIPYLSPLHSGVNLSVSWQWELNAWQNILIAFIFSAINYSLIKIKRESPFELVSSRINNVVVSLVKR
ncbi:metal-dependent hydrolase [Teredinibacter haidensis]|uniref:metal-dependent hydrolase n=1 Tax=Teredinibacter haidensis TaxID=2731755 RepID=UPI001C8E72F6